MPKTSTATAAGSTHPEYGAVWFPLEVRSRLGALPLRPLGLGAALGLDLGRRRALGLRAVPLRPLGALARPLGLVRRAPTWRGRCTRRRWWPGSAARNWGVSSTSAARPSAGCRWRRARSSCPGTARRRSTSTASIADPPPPPGRKPMPQVPTGPVMYGNQGVPGAVTVVPRDVLVQRQPVARAVIDPRGAGSPAQPWCGWRRRRAGASRRAATASAASAAPLPARREPRDVCRAARRPTPGPGRPRPSRRGRRRSVCRAPTRGAAARAPDHDRGTARAPRRPRAGRRSPGPPAGAWRCARATRERERRSARPGR